jgi:hypothetical protein
MLAADRRDELCCGYDGGKDSSGRATGVFGGTGASSLTDAGGTGAGAGAGAVVVVVLS